ncbi:MAG: AAA family ATPase [Halieaceae bacterium]|nr:AAA family ATPase [Halieaceae bacterium]
MRLPTYEELASVEEQLEVLEYPLDQPLFVVGPPGSGKTVLALQRAQMVAVGYGPVSIITYNRMLCRLLALMTDIDEEEVQSFTMHKFIWNDYKNRTKEEPPSYEHDNYTHNWPAMLTRLEQDVTERDQLHLVVDEGQDLPKGFFLYVSGHVSKAITVFADDDQALNSQRTTLEQIKQATGLDEPIILSKNHRNTPEIARLAEHFHSGRLPAAEVSRASNGELPRLLYLQGMEATANFVSNWSKARGGNNGVIVNRNATAENLHLLISNQLPGTRVDIYTNQRKNEDQINILSDGVTVLNKASVKGQEFDAVFILELERFIPCYNDEGKRGMYMMCSRARDYLFLVHGKNPLNDDAIAALPGPNVLERS